MGRNMVKRELAIGIDLGGTKMALAAANGTGRIVARLREPTQTGTARLTVEQMRGLATKLVAYAQGGNADVRAIAIGVPGVTDAENGRVIWAPNLPGWRDLPLARMLRRTFRAAYAVENDVDVAAVGENWRGAAKGVRNMYFIAVGTGIGSGLILDGRLYRGAGGVAGAVGWSVLEPSYLGSKKFRHIGMMEGLAAGPGIAARARAVVRGGKGKAMLKLASGKLKGITAEVVFRAARGGDALAKTLVRETGEYLGMGIANVISLLNPEMVVLGGGVGESGDLLLGTIRKVVSDVAQPVAAKGCRIRAAGLGQEAGVTGALKIALDLLHDKGRK